MDKWDVLGVLGTLLIGAGWWFIWEPAVLFWVGAVALIAGVTGARSGDSN